MKDHYYLLICLPLKYKPVDSAVRENKEVEKMLENYSIKGGIKVKSSKV